MGTDGTDSLFWQVTLEKINRLRWRKKMSVSSVPIFSARYSVVKDPREGRRSDSKLWPELGLAFSWAWEVGLHGGKGRSLREYLGSGFERQLMDAVQGSGEEC